MRVVLLLLVALLVPTASVAQPQPPMPAAAYAGKPIADVRLVSEGRPADEPAMVALVETRVGQPLSMAAVRETIIHLFSLGRFQDIQVDAVPAGDGVALRYDLVPLQTVSRVVFRGALGVSEGDVRRVMEDRFGRTPPVGRAAEVASLLEEQFYPDRGYLAATVKAAPSVARDPDRSVLAFDIDAGPRAIVRAVTFAGEPLEGTAAFLRALDVGPGDAYRPAEIRTRLAEYVEKLRKRGRYEAGATFVPAVDDKRTAVDLRFDVQPGPLITIVFRGDPLPKDRIKELVPVEREGSIDQDLLEDSTQRITEYLNQEGYWKASAQTSRDVRGDAVTIAFTIVNGLRYYVAPGGVLVNGNRQVPIELLRASLEGLEPGDVFVAGRLGAAVGAISATYLSRGFASFKIDTAMNELDPTPDGLGQVQPVIVIDEGPQTFVGEVTFEGNTHISSVELAGAVESGRGEPYHEAQIQDDRQAVQLAYLNAGFASAEVLVVPVVSQDRTRADLRFQIKEGPQTIVDHVIIVGNSRTDPRIIERELLLQSGRPLGLEDRLESQRRLAALGLFRRIRIDELPHGSPDRRDILVSVEEAAATSLSYGGGLEIGQRLRATGPGGEAEEHIEFAPRGFFDIGRRNIAGKNRSVNLFTRVSVRPQNASEDPTSDEGGIGFLEYRIVGTYREPRALGMRAADLIVSGVLEQGVRSSFNFARQGVNADMSRRLGALTRVSGRYSFGYTKTFDEQLSEREQADIDRLFPQVRLSSFGGSVSFDTRDDVIDPSRGGFLSAEAALAARALGGEVGFLKSYMQGFWFQTLPVGRRIIFATRAAVGLADGFPRTVETAADDGTATAETVEDLPASERFFAGGASTIRGFALDSVGAPNTIGESGFPRGGNAVLIMNAELRVPVWKDFGAALFVDGGNVFNRVTEFDLGELRGSYGIGVRYRSPLGPIRFDFGFKMDRREIAGTLERRRDFHFSIGHVF